MITRGEGVHVWDSDGNQLIDGIIPAITIGPSAQGEFAPVSALDAMGQQRSA